MRINAVTIRIAIGLAAILGASCSGTSTPRLADSKPGALYFAVSGDSRDCGDLIMPKIARSIGDNRSQAPVQFYWHLGDLRRMYDIDCDIIKRKHPDYDCEHRPQDELGPNEMNDYLSTAWDDFVERQIAPFGNVPFMIGIGNHELMVDRTRGDFRQKFQKWLTVQTLHAQRMADAGKKVLTNEGDTYYHFVKDGTDFIYLDNADGSEFDSAQIAWLTAVLRLDEQDSSVKTIVAGMHAALPYSTSRNHAMDATCQGICSGQRAYDLLYEAQGLSGLPEKQKHVYVLASHSHYFQERTYDTPEHQGRVLPGWIVGTAGAEQYGDEIKYGYLLGMVGSDGTLTVDFKQVTRDMPPQDSGPGGSQLTRFCFEQNKRSGVPDDAQKSKCDCGQSR